MKQITLTLLLLAAYTFSFAQSHSHLPNTQPEKCATMLADERLRQQYPDMGTLDDFERWLDEKMEEERENYSEREVLTIPVIVHIVHDGDPVGSSENVSAAQVQSQIDVLNEDFRKMMGTPGFNNDPVGADTEIEFCLAAVDPQGAILAEPGIHRYNGGQTSWDYLGNDEIDQVLKPATSWDPERYYNIWVCRIAGGAILGYAQFPNNSTLPGVPTNNGPANTDGVVIDFRSFGTTGTASFPSNGGRTCSHETGHWLGLRHIWGDGNCSQDDGCNDTPASDAANYGCATSHQSCGSSDMVNNYMDYSNDACMNIFTECQSTRMRTVLQNASRRANLLNSTVCSMPLAAPTPNFSISDTFSCDGTFQFTDESTEFPATWFWDFGNGQVSQDQNPTVTFDASGTYNVTFIASNGLGSNNVVIPVTVTVGPAPSVDVGADLSLCAGQNVQLQATTDQPNGIIQWSPSTGLSDDEILNPILDVTSSRFYYLTVIGDNGCSTTDTLFVQAQIGPSTYAGLDVAISPGGNVQLQAIGAQSYEWDPPTGLSCTNCANPTASPSVTRQYVVRGYAANGCYKDDAVTVTVTGTTNIGDAFMQEAGIVEPAYPNPATGEVGFIANLKATGDLKLSLYDLQGKAMETLYEGQVAEGEFQHTWTRSSNISAGVYMVVWEMNGLKYTQRLQLL